LLGLASLLAAAPACLCGVNVYRNPDNNPNAVINLGLIWAWWPNRLAAHPAFFDAAANPRVEHRESTTSVLRIHEQDAASAHDHAAFECRQAAGLGGLTLQERA